jgi:hypothetical protein
VFCEYFEDNRTNEAIDQVGALSSGCFPMAMSGEKVAGFLQTTSMTVILIAEEAVAAIAELLIAGAFLVDIIPILKYVPDWFPGAKFKRKAAMMRTHAERMRNATFEATTKLMVFIPWTFLWIVLQLFDDTYLGKWRL